ncbi:hypothetical protein DLJ58_00540 [Micromonospora arida]|uniref:Glycosyl hydrolase family 98 putative carbohydrate-binding module domain-containing protein n=2 Tax=Micromonospora arida TaxID=2203715 RepID=A0A3N9XPY9_9ACTN|nr:hypothetical protein DLJ58_00540 [Micromonospora arida]
MPARRGAQVAVALTVLGVLIAAAALARDVFDWKVGPGRPAASASTPETEPAAPSRANPGPDTSTSPVPARSVRLDTLAVEAGAAYLGKLPRQLAGQPEYDRPVVIGCPTNAGADKQRDVTYRLQRRYLDLTSTVRPFFSSDDERDGIVLVYAQVAIRQKDGTITRVTRGQQFDARMDNPQKLVADLEGADELTLRVQCKYPGGSVILTDAMVSAG